MVDFFWSSHHWRRAAVLYLPVHEGGQGLVDLESRVAAFRLQVAQRCEGRCWTHSVRRGGRSLHFFRCCRLAGGPESWWEEEKLLSFASPSLGCFEGVKGKGLYAVLVKVRNFAVLKDIREHQWQHYLDR